MCVCIKEKEQEIKEWWKGQANDNNYRRVQ